MGDCRLVMIEWEDSAQPISSWAYLASLDVTKAVRCVSVGWLIHDGDDVKALAPNMGNLNDESSVQVSGVIRIPTRCISRIVDLDEPELALANGASSAPSFRPATAPKQQAI
jgi:hypothetical protein